MQRYEYKVVPAPSRGPKAKGLKTPAERLAHALAEAMNAAARDGWEYLRTDALPCEEKAGLLSKPQTATRHMLVFRRALAERALAERALAERALAPAPAASEPAAEPVRPARSERAAPRAAAVPPLTVVPRATAPAAPPAEGARRMPMPARPEGRRLELPRLGGASGRGLFRTDRKPSPPPEGPAPQD